MVQKTLISEGKKSQVQREGVKARKWLEDLEVGFGRTRSNTPHVSPFGIRASGHMRPCICRQRLHHLLQLLVYCTSGHLHSFRCHSHLPSQEHKVNTKLTLMKFQTPPKPSSSKLCSLKFCFSPFPVKLHHL